MSTIVGVLPILIAICCLRHTLVNVRKRTLRDAYLARHAEPAERVET